MTYHYNTETLADLAKVCPAMQYLRGRITAILRGWQLKEFQVDIGDGEGRMTYRNNAAGIRDAAQWAVEVDDQVAFLFRSPTTGKLATLWVVYDGPYDKDTKDEVINDYTTSLDDFLSLEATA